MFVYGDFCPKLWTPQPMFVHEDFYPKLWTLQPNRHVVFVHGDFSKVVDTPGYLLDVCKFLCSVNINALYLFTREILVQSGKGYSSHSSLASSSSNKLLYLVAVCSFVLKWRQNLTHFTRKLCLALQIRERGWVNLITKGLFLLLLLSSKFGWLQHIFG